MKKLLGLVSIFFIIIYGFYSQSNVLIPLGTTVERLKLNGFDEMVKVIRAAGWEPYFSQPVVGGYTLFVPTDDAWKAFAKDAPLKYQQIFSNRDAAKLYVQNLLIPTYQVRRLDPGWMSNQDFRNNLNNLLTLLIYPQSQKVKIGKAEARILVRWRPIFSQDGSIIPIDRVLVP